LLTLCTAQDHVIVLTPCYQSLSEIPKFVGCSLTTIDLKEENDWRIDITAIKAAIKPNTKLVVINFPHNPTGQIITSRELSELIQLLDEHGIWLFSDEVYYLLGSKKAELAKPAATLYKKAISLGVLSKAYGMPGLRVGWVACQDQDMLQRITKTKHYTSLCNSGPSEIISLIALRNQDTVLKRNNDIVAHNLSLLDTFFKKYSHTFSWVRPQGGCTGLVKYHDAESIDVLCDRLIKQAHILLLPGSVYGVESNHFRIGFGRKNMPEALAEFEKFLKNEST
jgi:aspartate/methionine/tyrosine aminotransferase